MIDFGKRLEERVDSLLAQRARAVANVRMAYEDGRIQPGTNLTLTRHNFGMIRGQLKIAVRELKIWQERHPS